MNLQTVKVSQLVKADYNPGHRSTVKYCQDILDTAKDLGILEPLRVTPEFVLIDGHRRLAAARHLGIEEVR